jgi:hypothetical protein
VRLSALALWLSALSRSATAYAMPDFSVELSGDEAEHDGGHRQGLRSPAASNTASDDWPDRDST